MKQLNVLLLLGFALAFVIVISGFANAAEQTVCCEKTKSDLFCQDVPASECAAGAKQVPTSCKSTSYCRPGTCFDSIDGTCLDNTPENVCTDNKGSWSLASPPQCGLGCCIIGDQAAFVTLTRCKKLSSLYGLETNYKKDITSEVQCILTVQGQEKGACVYESDYQKTCRMTTRADCTRGKNSTQVNFYTGKLCSSEQLGTLCGPTSRAVCVPGKEEVYFVDTCGNPANIYDSSKIDEPAYWENILDKTESCNPNSANSNSKTCGNCNYILGSVCRVNKGAGPANICVDLNCKGSAVELGGKTTRLHGESWCVYSDAGKLNENNNAVGSRYYKHICINGEVVLEQCADYRQHECIEDKITTTQGTDFSQAACRVNRWQDCFMQGAQEDCVNTDKRDCNWIGRCVPKNSPGLQFWEGDEAKAVCAQANAQCTVKYEKTLYGGKKEVVSGKDCESGGWRDNQIKICMAMGDCGPKINWVGASGYTSGYTYA